MTPRRFPFVAAIAAMAVSLAGCENPFDPKADVKLLRWNCNAGLTAQLVQATAGTNGMSDSGLQTTEMHLGNFTSVPVLFTSYVAVYRQIGAQDAPVNLPPGSPIPSLGGAAGRRYAINYHMQAVTSPTNGSYSDIYTTGATTFQPRLITREFLNYVATNPGTTNGGIDIEVEVFGTDHNGHDVKVGGVLHVEIF